MEHNSCQIPNTRSDRVEEKDDDILIENPEVLKKQKKLKTFFNPY
jgi:hypothetical protein